MVNNTSKKFKHELWVLVIVTLIRYTAFEIEGSLLVLFIYFFVEV